MTDTVTVGWVLQHKTLGFEKRQAQKEGRKTSLYTFKLEEAYVSPTRASARDFQMKRETVRKVLVNEQGEARQIIPGR